MKIRDRRVPPLGGFRAVEAGIQNTPSIFGGPTISRGLSVGDALEELARFVTSLSYRPAVPAEFSKIGDIITGGIIYGRIADGVVGRSHVDTVKRVLASPQEAMRHAVRLVETFRRGGISPQSGRESREGPPLCWVMGERGAECFMDPECLRQTYTGWWGFTFYFCDIFWDRDCPCRGLEVEWLDVLLAVFLLAAIKNQRAVWEWLKKLGRLPGRLLPKPSPIPGWPPTPVPIGPGG